MGLGPFTFISLFYAVIGVRSIFRLIQRWSPTWDKRFTQQDRQLVDETAFFVLIPISVALHELGHALTVWGLGGKVAGWGYYGFAGYVSYYPFQFSTEEQTLIAAAGSLVNLALCLLAFAIVFFRVFRLRASVNELLLQFAFLSGLNAFIVYPLLDVLSGLNGDWRQMYDSGVTWVTVLIAVVHVAVLGGGYYLATNPAMKARAAQLTDVPPGFVRGLLGGIQPGKIDLGALPAEDQVLREAVNRVSSGWSSPVQSQIQQTGNGMAITLQWLSANGPRVAAVRRVNGGQTDLLAIDLRPGNAEPPPPRLLYRWVTTPSADELTLALRQAMETLNH